MGTGMQSCGFGHPQERLQSLGGRLWGSPACCRPAPFSRALAPTAEAHSSLLFAGWSASSGAWACPWAGVRLLNHSSLPGVCRPVTVMVAPRLTALCCLCPGSV